jgi:hypothetical protein
MPRLFTLPLFSVWDSHLESFKELRTHHLNIFMKILLDDFTFYNNMETHLQKFKLCFQKCKEYNISLNLEKCFFVIFYIIIIGFIVSKERKLLKKIHALMNMPIPWNSQ